MTLYVFKCSTRQTRAGITMDVTGGNLPASCCDGGKWVSYKTIEIDSGSFKIIGAKSPTEILASIETFGYSINDFNILFTEL